jgi:uncharacterized protein YprB with RNaseH-like and TPR domain
VELEPASTTSPEASAKGAPSEPSAEGASSARLEALRLKVQRALGGERPPEAGQPRERGGSAAPSALEPSSPKSGAHAGGSSSDWPFEARATPSGSIEAACVAYAATHLVGEVPLGPAASAVPELLALLALDPSLSGLDPRRALFLDTETTGLSKGAGTVAFLVGLARWKGPSLELEQLLLADFASEAAMLEHLKRRLDEASFVVSFNGKSFDLPLLRGRAVMARVGALPERPHLDLLHVARRIHGGRLGSTTLRALEEQVLGMTRVGDVAGEEVAACYFQWLRSSEPGELLPVVRHNALDVLSMVALVGLYGESLSGSSLDARAAQASARREQLHPDDIAGAARVLARAGELELAEAYVEASLSRGGGAAALSLRGDLAKARGDKSRALRDYEAALERSATRALGTASARELGLRGRQAAELRLALAKLYEHHVRDFERALATLEAPTTEPVEQHARRVARLLVKRSGAKPRG